MDDGKLRAWHAENRRPLAVRAAGTPWSVLVAEVMSQQTQIDRVGPFWGRFVTRWATPAALADASTRELLDAWAGLGYNRRALALREAARAIVERHGGDVPRTVMELEGLPGIGPYTARAVAAAAFGVPAAPLDVNVRRVVGRVIGEVATSRRLQERADMMVWPEAPGAWVEAVMDLAVVVCTPRAPRCADCPIARDCLSRGRVKSRVPLRRVSRPFTSTRRWLRGELVRRLRAVPAGEWMALGGPIGEHPAAAVREALAGLEADGFVEVAVSGVRLSIG